MPHAVMKNTLCCQEYLYFLKGLLYFTSGERDLISKSFESLQIFTCLKINEVASYIFFAHLQVIIQCTMRGQFNQRGQEINSIPIILLTLGALNLERVHKTLWNQGK